MSEVAYQLLIPILAFLSVVAIGSSVLIGRKHKRQMVEVRLQDDRWVELPDEKKGTEPSLLKVIAQIGNFVSHGHSKKSLSEQLLRAGYVSPAAPAIYTGIKILLFVAGVVVMTLVVTTSTEYSAPAQTTIVLLGATALFFIPNLVVTAQLKRRHDEIRRHLPEAIDLLEICVSSGIGLDMAWNMVSNEVQNVSPVLSNAMSLTNFEINLGASRTEAMRHMSDRTGVEELSSLAAILIQTERFGTSIAETLRIFATAMREERSYTAEENAEKMAVKLIFPMVLFIFPAVIITVAGPAFMSIFRALIIRG